jgi:cytidylate kinase
MQIERTLTGNFMNKTDKNRYPQHIAIDGPAASGKSTIAKILADEIGYLFFDTGVMYRAVTYEVLERQIDFSEEDKISEVANQVDIDIRPTTQADGRSYDVLLNGEDITWQIRKREVDSNVSIVAAYPGVRKALTRQQRKIAERGEIVMVGRDIGTVVLPDADLKIFLNASAEERAKRRYQELVERGENVEYESILESIHQRDEIDSTREVAPLKAADDAIHINTDGLSITEVIDSILDIIEVLRNNPS